MYVSRFLYPSLYVYIYIYIYICMHISLSLYIYIYIHTYIHTPQAKRAPGPGGAAARPEVAERDVTAIMIIVNNIPHGHALFGVSWYSLVTCGTRCAQKSMSSYNTCDHLGSSNLWKQSDALVPDRLRVKTGRPAHGRVLIHYLNGLLDDVVSGQWV